MLQYGNTSEEQTLLSFYQQQSPFHRFRSIFANLRHPALCQSRDNTVFSQEHSFWVSMGQWSYRQEVFGNERPIAEKFETDSTRKNHLATVGIIG